MCDRLADIARNARQGSLAAEHPDYLALVEGHSKRRRHALL